jgi:hypothetical protein
MLTSINSKMFIGGLNWETTEGKQPAILLHLLRLVRIIYDSALHPAGHPS